MGYNIKFLDNKTVFLPNFRIKDIVKLNYCHFTVFHHIKRKLPVLTAVNIFGKSFIQHKRNIPDNWKHDKRLDRSFQLDNNFYKGTKFQKGHLVRRLDPSWGNISISKKAVKDTFHFTNCAPQHKNLNQKIWLELEKHILEKGSIVGDMKLTVLSGPVLSNKDRPYYSVKMNACILIPSLYWKIILWQKEIDKKLYAVGFIQSQWEWIKDYLIVPRITPVTRTRNKYDNYFENLKFKDNKVYQVSIAKIEELAGINFQFKNIILPYKKVKQQELISNQISRSNRDYGNKRNINVNKNSNNNHFEIQNLIL